jgi:hypothetical protein
MRSKTSLCAALALILLAALGAQPTTLPVVHLTGALNKPGDWSADRIKTELASDMKSVSYSSHGAQHSSNCVPLISLLQAAGAETTLKMNPTADPKTKNHSLRLIVLVQGNDGYTVAFSLAELLPDIGNRDAWLALDQDGQPLSTRDAPLRLIVPADGMPARWVHAIAEIRVIDPTAPTTQPAN